MIIGFSGKMGVGKTTAIETLEEFAKTAPKIVKFAQPLYDMQEYIYRRIAQVHQRPVDFKKDRKLLQWIGTEWGRETVSESIWVDIWAQDVAFLTQKIIKAPVVCDDVRFDNEAATIKQMGGYVISIIRDDNTKHAHGGVGIVNHASETGIDKKYIDFVVDNNDTVKVFKAKLFECYKAIAADITPKLVF